MFGFIIGTLCLIALVRTLFWRRHRYSMLAYGGPHAFGGGPFFHGHGYGYGHGGYGYGHGYGRGRGQRWGGYGGGPGFGAGRALFAHLDTTPGQEKAIAQAVGTLREHLEGSRDELRGARKDLAAALGGDVLDTAALEAALGRGQAVTQTFARELSRALADVHGVLDGEQRKQLAELIADGAPWHGFGPRRW
jgi:uncharacterized membrane protein